MEKGDDEIVFDLMYSLNGKVRYPEYYRLVLYGLDIDHHIEVADQPFIELFQGVSEKLKGSLGDAVSLTCAYLEKFEAINLADIEPYRSPDFKIEQSYPEVDLRLTIAKFLQLGDHDKRTVMTHISHDNDLKTSLPVYQFVQDMCDRRLVTTDDISKLQDLQRYKPAIIDEYLDRHPKAKQNFSKAKSLSVSKFCSSSTAATKSQESAGLTKFSEAPKWQDKNVLAKPITLPPITPFSSELVKDIKVLLMTATDDEEKGVLTYLEPKDKGGSAIRTLIDDDSGIILHIGKYGNNPVIVVKSAESKRFQGSIHAAIVLTIVLRECKDIKYVISTGICFGMGKDDKFADIHISDLVDDQSTKRIGTSRADTHYRSGQPTVPRNMLHKFETAENFSLPTEPQYSVNVKKGPIIAANTLVDNLAEKEKMRENRPDAVGGEMEGAGIMAAIEYVDNVKAIIIKAVGDRGDGSKDRYRGWKPFAARAAAYYVKEMLSAETFN